MPLFVLSRLLSSLWVSHTGSASDWCAPQEALYKCIDTIQYNNNISWRPDDHHPKIWGSRAPSPGWTQRCRSESRIVLLLLEKEMERLNRQLAEAQRKIDKAWILLFNYTVETLVHLINNNIHLFRTKTGRTHHIPLLTRKFRCICDVLTRRIYPSMYLLAPVIVCSFSVGHFVHVCRAKSKMKVIYGKRVVLVKS